MYAIYQKNCYHQLDSYTSVPQAFYFLLQDVCDKKSHWDDETLTALRSCLVAGLNDHDDSVRQSVFQWWNRTLPKDPSSRLKELFCLRPLAPQRMDKQWLINSASLLMQLCRDASSNASKLFGQDLAWTQKISFKEKKISSSAVSFGSLQRMTPMFANSLPFSQVAQTQTMSLGFGGSTQSQRERSLQVCACIVMLQIRALKAAVHRCECGFTLYITYSFFSTGTVSWRHRQRILLER